MMGKGFLRRGGVAAIKVAILFIAGRAENILAESTTIPSDSRADTFSTLTKAGGRLQAADMEKRELPDDEGDDDDDDDDEDDDDDDID